MPDSIVGLSKIFLKSPNHFALCCNRTKSSSFHKNVGKPLKTQKGFMTTPDWTLPFEVMCDATEWAIRAVLGQRKDKIERNVERNDNSKASRSSHQRIALQRLCDIYQRLYRDLTCINPQSFTIRDMCPQSSCIRMHSKLSRVAEKSSYNFECIRGSMMFYRVSEMIDRSSVTFDLCDSESSSEFIRVQRL
ncbi:hypothetical protein OSB04_024491 [Centaurea solstitialis]|uniref:Reverse transcriptase/retrotransposon-derived protein RNase H-like domain-containing protein n=1 Tax=Centaurea solstitialis TaxID=347529 RepID=A0AA38SL81_9ASTR|nr:hypothetical protein OSB04_024491 [Centaurea solstitialis]